MDPITVQTLIEQQQKQFFEMMQKFTSTLSPPPPKIEPTFDSLTQAITEFNYDPENDSTFDAWFKRFEDVFKVDGDKLDDAAKVRLLLRKLSTSAHEKYTNFILPKQPRDFSFNETVMTLKDMFSRQTSLFNTRYQCLKLSKCDSHDYVTYAGIVNRECDRFELGTLTDDQFKCLIFVCGLQSPRDSDIRLRLLNKIETEKDVTIKSLSDECKRLINLKHDSQMLEHASPVVAETSTKAISSSRPQRKTRKSKPTKHQPENHSIPRTPCWFCGAMHYVRNCPYRQHHCTDCGQSGHKEGYCSARKQDRNRPRSRPQQPHAKESRRSNGVHAVFKPNLSVYRRFAFISVNGQHLKFRVDTGSDITVLSQRTWERLGSPSLTSTSLEATDVSGNTMSFLGQLDCDFRFQGYSAQATCYVSNRSSIDLLGVELIQKLGMYDKPMDSCSGLTCDWLGSQSVGLTSDVANAVSDFAADIANHYPAIFQPSLGHCFRAKATLKLRPDARPVFRPKRPVPYATLPALEKELDRLEENGIISKVNYSAWAAPIVVVKKANGSLRICADFSTGLNEALELHQYPLPLPEDIFATLNGGKVFSRIDLTDAYLQVEVDDTSKELLVINTHRGLYRYNRLPFGVKSAPGIFQQIMDTMLSGLQGAVAYLDDVIVMGRTEEEHRRNLDAVFRRIEDYGFHIKAEKCSFFRQSIKYLGFIIDKDGRRPDPAKVEAIQRMPAPTDIASLRSFLGLINYYGAFIKEMREIRAPLDALLKKDAKFFWSSQCQSAFDRAKSVLSSDLLLTHFDPSLDIIVAADASNQGIGAVILHRFPDGAQKAIVHSSRSLTAAEKNYSQIEKEALALVFAVRKFHRMIHGRKFTLLTDHQPLVAVFGSKKGIPVYTANRLQRWATMLLGYNFVIEYRSTTKFGCADALSRLISGHVLPEEDVVIASVDADVRRDLLDSVRHLPVTAEMIRDATKKDSLLQTVVRNMHNGWPETTPHNTLRQFLNRRGSLSMLDGCILLADRVVVPASLQQRVLRQLHSAHPGIVRMKALARSLVYWPGLDKEIEQLVRHCDQCAAVAKSPVKTTLATWPMPTKPWSRVHIDYAGPFEGQYFLVVVDAFSKWPEIFMTDRITATVTLNLLRQLFSRFGMPEILVSDNGTQFSSAQFKQFCQRNGIEHIFSPAYHPQSNGQAERFVDTFKRSILKLKGEGPTAEILQTFLLNYRSSPNPTLENSVSPAELFLGRKLRTSLNLLIPSADITSHAKDVAMEAQFNRHHGARRRSFEPGDTVYVRDNRGSHPSWVSGKVLRRRGRVVYEVQVGANVWTRHINQLRARFNLLGHEHAGQALQTILETFDMDAPRRAGYAEPPAPQAFDEDDQSGNGTQEDLHYDISDRNVDVDGSDGVIAQPRRSQRSRQPTRQFSPDPRSSSYSRPPSR
ncbi:hypothetical protein AB6A40_003540 [Gnathostoma spinigerum]|uniref:RNA-directed DNA polymerase n=1 Tax=Gnathostoma spinigerum TaxID=75299 RepID=A0ABD6ECA9_9BILA